MHRQAVTSRLLLQHLAVSMLPATAAARQQQQQEAVRHYAHSHNQP
jgi:hypothetical protein